MYVCCLVKSRLIQNVSIQLNPNDSVSDVIGDGEVLVAKSYFAWMQDNLECVLHSFSCRPMLINFTQPPRESVTHCLGIRLCYLAHWLLHCGYWQT